MEKIIKFFDKLEDKIRRKLSRCPIIYALVGSVGIILLWRGVWMTADMFNFMTGPVSVIIGTVTLLLVGLFVSFFIGDQIIISGIKAERRIDEKTEEEIRHEIITFGNIKNDLDEIKNQIKEIREKIEKSGKIG